MSQLAASRSAFSSRSSVTSRQSAASAAAGVSMRQKTASAATTSLTNGPIGFSAGLHEGSFASQRGRGGLGRLTSLLIRMPAILVRSGNPCQRRRSTIPYVSPDEAGARSVVRRRPSRRQGVDCLRTRGLHRVPTLLYGLTLGCYPCPASPTHSRRGRQTSRKSSDDAHLEARSARGNWPSNGRKGGTPSLIYGDRRGHERVSQCGSPRELGRPLSGEQ